MPNTLENWTDNFGPNHVQPLDGLYGKGTGYISSESVIVCSATASYAESTQDMIESLTPIGLVENAAVQQSKQLQQLFEIGSRRPFFVPGRVQISATLARVMFNGPSLMKTVYQNVTPPLEEQIRTNTVTVDDLPGPVGEDFYINLASEYFNHPLGLAFLIRDMDKGGYGGFFLEECFIQGHQFSLAAQQTVLLENVSLRAAAIQPISIKQFPNGPDGE
ncbi:MAG: hypothetical protein H8E12_16980 [Rhodobacteraceae bacterium]|nr:hypothetical protein [Paracoccaceae bacterium]